MVTSKVERVGVRHHAGTGILRLQGIEEAAQRPARNGANPTGTVGQGIGGRGLGGAKLRAQGALPEPRVALGPQH